MSRKFTKEIYMGCSGPKVRGGTDDQIKLLKKRLDEGITWLSGLQQLATSPAVFPASERGEFMDGKDEIIDIVADIAVALGCTVLDCEHECSYVLDISLDKS